MKCFIKYTFFILVYACIFILIYGLHPFNPFYTDWIFSLQHYWDGDIVLNYLDFYAFLNSELAIPFLDTNAYPFISSIYYIDFFPALSCFIKVIFSIFKINTEFQYVWYYGILCFLLQGILSYKIIYHFTNNKISSFLSSLFFIIAPPFLYRFPSNFTLFSHFLIFLSFLPFIFRWSSRKLLFFYFTLGFIIAGIAQYFYVNIMCNLLTFVLYQKLKNNIKISFGTILIFVFNLGFLLQSLFLGAFMNTNKESTGSIIIQADGYRICTHNLNQFLNPNEYFNLFSSNLFPFFNELKVFYEYGQIEGFSYLGGGVIILLIFSIIVFFCNLQKYNIKQLFKNYKCEIISLFFLLTITLFLSTSADITLGQYTLFSIKLNDKLESLLSVFRAPGRFIWNNFYILYFTIFVFIIKNFDKKISLCILTVALSLQVYDLNSSLQKLHNLYKEKVSYSSTLKNEKWKFLKENKSVLLLIDYEYDKNIFYYGVKNKLKMPTLMTSRLIRGTDEFLAKHYLNPQDEDLFVWEYNSETINFLKQRTKYKHCYHLDEYLACVNKEIENLKDNKIKL